MLEIGGIRVEREGLALFVFLHAVEERQLQLHRVDYRDSCPRAASDRRTKRAALMPCRSDRTDPTNTTIFNGIDAPFTSPPLGDHRAAGCTGL